MANTTNFNWETPGDTDLVKDGAAAIRTLGSAIDTSLVDLKGGTTGQVLSKATNTDMDFTWVAQDDSNAIQNAIVDAKGDLIAATANDTPARLAVGTNGQVLTADSTAATGLAWATASSSPTSYGYAAGKNAIINGDFRINQRNFTSTTTTNTYGHDRWFLDYAGGTTTYSTQAFTPGTAPVAGYEGINFARLVSTSQSSASNYVALTQRIEDVRTFAGQTLTVSFWAKASTGTPNVGVSFFQQFGTGGSSTVVSGNSVIPITSSWARYTATISIASVSGKTIGASSYLNMYLFTSVGTTVSGSGYAAVGLQNATIDFWGVQVEAGSTATAFQTATGTIQGELAACQRYFYRQQSNSVSGMNFGTGAYFNTTDAYLWITFPVELRTTASSSYTVGSLVVFANGTSKTPTGLFGSGASRYGQMVITSGITGATAGQACIYQTAGTSNVILDFSAEL